MNNDIGYSNNPRNGKAVIGIILLAVGVVLLLQEFVIPDNLDIRLWPLWLVGWGVFIGAKSNYSKPSSFVLIVLGGIFLFTENIHNSKDIIWPLAIITFGLWMILRRHNNFDKNVWEKKNSDKWDWNKQPGAAMDEPVVDYMAKEPPPVSGVGSRPTGDEFLDAVSIFGGVKKVILSKDFKGGEVVNIFGGAELDFTQADIGGRIIIDITQIFGSTKIIVPPHWQIVSDVAAVFGSIDDKRMRSTAAVNSNKILVLKGVSIFAGVDVRSY